MSAPVFVPGEIAVLQNLKGEHVHLNGEEVTILTARDPEGSYQIDSPAVRSIAPRLSVLFGAKFFAYEDCLKKRPQPPDWNAMFGLKDKSLELA